LAREKGYTPERVKELRQLTPPELWAHIKKEGGGHVLKKEGRVK
jgi:hypothetical protein